MFLFEESLNYFTNEHLTTFKVEYGFYAKLFVT